MHVIMLLRVIKVCERLLNDAPQVAAGHTKMCKECSRHVNMLMNDAPHVAAAHTKMCKECSDAREYADACDQGTCLYGRCSSCARNDWTGRF